MPLGGGTLDLSGRVPVLAVGSNQSPEQLAHKFNGTSWGAVPTIRVELTGFDSVYSSHISAYGSIPATLYQAPGTTVRLFVNWLNSDQLKHMHETEIGKGNYAFGMLNGVTIDAEVGPTLSQVHLYTSNHGALNHDGKPVPLSEIQASGRSWSAMVQTEAQHHVRDHLDPEKPLNDFILESIANPQIGCHRTDRLRLKSHAFTHRDWRILAA